MGIHCRLGHHHAAPQVRANGGASFALCRGCGRDLILSASGWRPVPRGYRVVWRSEKPDRAADPAQLDLALPEPAGPPAGVRRIARPAAPPAHPPRLRTGRMLKAAATRSTA